MILIKCEIKECDSTRITHIFEKRNGQILARILRWLRWHKLFLKILRFRPSFWKFENFRKFRNKDWVPPIWLFVTEKSVQEIPLWILFSVAYVGRKIEIKYKFCPDLEILMESEKRCPHFLTPFLLEIFHFLKRHLLIV